MPNKSKPVKSAKKLVSGKKLEKKQTLTQLSMLRRSLH